MATSCLNAESPATKNDAFLDEMWDLVMERIADKLASDTTLADKLLPVEILLLLAEKVLNEMNAIVQTCLLLDDDSGEKEKDLLHEIHTAGPDTGKWIALPKMLCQGLGLSSSGAWVKKKIEDPSQSRLVEYVHVNRDKDDKSKVPLLPADHSDNEGTKSGSKLDFCIDNERLVCLIEHCGAGYSSFQALKKHFEMAHLKGRSDSDLGLIPDVGLRSVVERVKVEPDFFSDDEEEEERETVEAEEDFATEPGKDGASEDEDPSWEMNPPETKSKPYRDGVDNLGTTEDSLQENSYDCGMCNNRYKSKMLLEKHVKLRHRPPAKCGHCQKEFDQISKYNKHLKSNECPAKEAFVPLENRTCSFCEMTFESRALLSKHEKTHQGPIKCKECGTILANRDIYKQHVKDLHTNSNDSICEECGMSFKNRRYLWGHVKNHHSGKFILCTDCGKHFKPSAYRDHRKYKHSATPLTRIQCEFCENTFRSKLTLKTHQAIVHGKGDRTVLQCQRCPRKCSSQSQMDRHVMAAHLGLKQHVCPQCNKEFCHKDSLKKHMALTHGTGDQRVLKCDQCPKKFVSEARLKEHVMVMHMGVKHLCPNCSKEFSRKSSMRKHLKNGKCTNVNGNDHGSQGNPITEQEQVRD